MFASETLEQLSKISMVKVEYPLRRVSLVILSILIIVLIESEYTVLAHY